jgi:UPF0755 protein
VNLSLKKIMPSMMKRIFGFIASILGLVLFCCLAVMGIVSFCNSPPALPDTSEREGIEFEYGDGLSIAAHFDVRKGESAHSVGQRLEESGLIRSRYFWQLLCRFEKKPIKNGFYRIEIPSNQLAIHRLLASGQQMLLRVTVPEGLTLKKTAALIEEARICAAEEFLAAASDSAMIEMYRIPGKTMEGYLYPDTYLFTSGYPAKKIIQTMVNTFFSKIGEIDEKTRSMPPEELNRIVTLASIIEREYRLAEEAPLMAGVFFNRLNIGMALQSCATVEYVITEIQGKPHPETLLTRDTEIRDPYNTYIYPGLPPGPIASPGAVSLKAVLSPTKNNYFYFRLVDPDSGRHYFSVTLDDHIKAGKLYLKGN